MDIRIFNATPHSICVVSSDCIEFKEDLRKYVVKEGMEATVVASIPPSGQVLSAQIETVELEPRSIPVFGKKVVGADPLPEGYDIIIVSALYASALRMLGADTSTLSKLYTVADPVYSRDGRMVLGCRGICPAF